MTTISRAGRLPAVLLAVAAAAAGAERWQMQYLYDEEKSTLTINDIRFASAQRGVAVGWVAEGKRTRPTSLVTSDGGAHWAPLPTKETGLSVFFLNEALGWMVTEPRGLWRTTEAGRSWTHLPNPPKGLYRVWFLDENHGFGVGVRKTAVETTDGGKHWTPVSGLSEVTTRPEYTSFTWITFAGKVGVITGASIPPRPSDAARPDWVDPDAAIRRAERPHLSLLLQTTDAGKLWKPASSSMFGRVSRFRIAPNGVALALVEGAYTWPSEVHRLLGTSKSDIVYQKKDRAVTDMVVTPAGAVYLAGIEVSGKMPGAPIPGKLKIVRSTDLSQWTEIPVDYRAVATRAILSLVDADNIWVATDTGMILKLVR